MQAACEHCRPLITSHELAPLILHTSRIYTQQPRHERGACTNRAQLPSRERAPPLGRPYPLSSKTFQKVKPVRRARWTSTSSCGDWRAETREAGHCAEAALQLHCSCLEAGPKAAWKLPTTREDLGRPMRGGRPALPTRKGNLRRSSNSSSSPTTTTSTTTKSSTTTTEITAGAGSSTITERSPSSTAKLGKQLAIRMA